MAGSSEDHYASYCHISCGYVKLLSETYRLGLPTKLLSFCKIYWNQCGSVMPHMLVIIFCKPGLKRPINAAKIRFLVI